MQPPTLPQFPEGLTPEQEELFLTIHGQAHNIEAVLPACYLARTAGSAFASTFDPQSFGIYNNNVVSQAGEPTDPVERMMVQLLTLTFHSIGRLHVQATEAQSPEEAKVFNAAAARLTGEYRRTALALKTYRMPIVQKSFTVVKQANVTTGTQQVAYLDQEAQQATSATQNNQPRKALSHVEFKEFVPRTTPADRTQPEPCEAPRGKRRTARNAKTINLPMETVATLDGAEVA